ncbi:MAG: hypothetical protein WCD38_08985 [Candidatus Tumulicola sp.]
MPSGVTFTPAPPIEGRTFVCKRCKRVYPYPEPGDRPIRCECGWWYVNEGSGIRETYYQRIESYRTPRDLRRLFRH